MISEEAICSMGESVRYSRRKFGEIKCESRKVGLHWNNIKKFVLGSMSDLVERPEGETRNKKAMDYSGSDQSNGWKREVEKCQQRRWKEQMKKEHRDT
jgi:hypothetical protein